MCVTENVRRYAKRLPRGKPVPTVNFLHLGSRAAVDQALSRVVREGALSRVGRGLFVRPKISPYVGQLPPSVEEIVKAKAAGAIVQVNGARAAMDLGLSTQVPTQTLYLTSGPSHSFKVGRLAITLKHAPRRRLALAGRPAGLAISAFWYLGKEGLVPEVIEKVREKLPAEEFQALRAVMTLMPIWMQGAFEKYETLRHA